MASLPSYPETIEIPGSVRFPIELEPPAGFDPERLETWPCVEGRLEWVGGRLLYMPPCGDRQQYVVTDLVLVLGAWARARPDFVVGTNEAGMYLGGSVRGADAAVWRRADVRAPAGGLQRVPPILAVEVSGREEREDDLREKARWYLRSGVSVVWLVLAESREVLVISRDDERRYGAGEVLAAHPDLPGLTPRTSEFFRQIVALQR